MYQSITTTIFIQKRVLRPILKLLVKFSSLKSVPDPSYALPRRRRRRRRRRIPRLGTRTGSTLLFSATTRFCDMKQERKYSFLTSRSIAKTRCTIRSSGVLLQTGRVFLMTFMVVVKSYMEVSNETSDSLYIQSYLTIVEK